MSPRTEVFLALVGLPLAAVILMFAAQIWSWRRDAKRDRSTSP